MSLQVRVVRLPHAADLPLPQYQSAQAAGLDLLAAVPAGTEGQVRPRSGLAARDGVTVLNSPGTVDADYRGELQVILVNLGAEPFVVRRGMRVAQLVVAPVQRAEMVEVASLDATGRATGGFGSTGVASKPAGGGGD